MEIGNYEQAQLEKYITDDFKNANIKKIISILEYYNVFTYFDEVEESLIEYYDIPYGIQDYVDFEALAEDSIKPYVETNKQDWITEMINVFGNYQQAFRYVCFSITCMQLEIVLIPLTFKNKF